MANLFPDTKDGATVSVLLSWKQGGESTLDSPAEFLEAIKPVELELYHLVGDKYAPPCIHNIS